MRVVIDMQGAQTESRFRGIGRYTMSLAKAIVRNRKDHEIILALNGLFPETIESIRGEFNDLLSQENIRVWHAPGPVNEEICGNSERRKAAELVRESFLTSLQPDIIHISSLFEGYIDDAVTSIGRFDKSTLISVTLYDLIPLINSDKYLKPFPRYAQYYNRKLDFLKQADVCFAISKYAGKEALEYLNIENSRIVNISTAADDLFSYKAVNTDHKKQLLRKFNITRSFVFYTGGADKRKNLPRLIEAFSNLKPELRVTLQLVIAGKIPDSILAQLIQLAKKAGCSRGDIIFVGYVTDEDLVNLYTLCKVFVFPSWHEGFGLPALEAMSCGAPVLCANKTSLPEVVELDDAMFDPFDVASICAKLSQVLADDTFRSMLTAHGFQQAKKFSWDKSARKAIEAWEQFTECKKGNVPYGHCLKPYDRLIQSVAKHIPEPVDGRLAAIAGCIAQNQNNGIERQLLIDVSELSSRDAASGVQRVVRSYLKEFLENPPSGFRVEPVYATLETNYRYARNFTRKFMDGGSGAHDEWIFWQRGDIFFGLDMQHHVQLKYTDFFAKIRNDGVTVKFLVHDLLPIQLESLFRDLNAKSLHERLLAMIAKSDGAVCVSQASADAYKKWIKENSIQRSPNFTVDWVHNGADIQASKPSRGIPENAVDVLKQIKSRPAFLCVATIEPRKGQEQILNAMELLWGDGIDVNLIFVGRIGWKMNLFSERIKKHPETHNRLFWLEGISDEYLDKIYDTCSCLVAASINEGFGLPVIEAAQHQLPIIARDIPVFREVAQECAFYFKGETPEELSVALKNWLALYQTNKHPISNHLKWHTWHESSENLKQILIHKNYPRNQLLVDISELVIKDAGTGIQRVVKNILEEWLNNPPEGYRVEPVYATMEKGYRYARRFTNCFRCDDLDTVTDEFIEYAPGDVFLGLDLQPQIVNAQRQFYRALRREGVIVKFLVYDLLCVEIPECFYPGGFEGFTDWLKVITENDGAVCISRSTADKLSEWISLNCPTQKRDFSIGWFHIGSDFIKRPPQHDLPIEEKETLNKFRQNLSFLMVGTLEPRKGHKQVVDAFDLLWQSGTKANLVIVGKQGWMVEDFVQELHTHPENGKQLFWLEGISDEYLNMIYSSCTCLIAASYGEGFGLPLIEAAFHKIPIIARDIPVFREVAGKHAYYFIADTSEKLFKAIKNWLSLYGEKKHPVSVDMPWLTWKESARQLYVNISTFGD